MIPTFSRMHTQMVLHSWAKTDTHTHNHMRQTTCSCLLCGDTAEQGRERWPIIHHPAPWTSGAEYNLSKRTGWYNHHSAPVSVSPCSLSNWLISSLPTAWICIIHVEERQYVCVCVCICHRWQGVSWEVDAGWTREKMVSLQRHQADVGWIYCV